MPSEASIASIQTFDPLVKGHALFTGRDRQIEFFLAERPFFGSDAKTAAHFARIRKANIPGSQTLLHEDAASRLEVIATELGASMPQSGGIGWPRVSRFDRREPQTIADPHTTGLAIDYDATEMPHLGNRARQGRHALAGPHPAGDRPPGLDGARHARRRRPVPGDRRGDIQG